MSDTTMTCPFCGGVADFVRKVGRWLRQYKCRECKRTFEK
jgi:transposase-like protein